MLYAHEYPKKKSRTMILFAGIILVATMAFLSGSRTGLIGTTIILVVYKRSVKWFFSMLLIAAAIYFVVEPHSESGWAEGRYERIYTAFQTGNPRSIGEVEFRMNHLEMGLNAFYEKPLFGYGYGSWNEIRGSAMNMIGSRLAPHNAYAILLGETGGVGIVLFILMIILHLRGLPISPGNNQNETLGYVALIGILIYVVLGFNSSSFWYRDFSVYLGLASAAKVREALSRESKTDSLTLSSRNQD